MEATAGFRRCSATDQLESAQQIVGILFKQTGLSTIVRKAPTVIVGAGNWISFAVDQAVSAEAVLALTAPSGGPAFVPDMLNRRGSARSKANPSLHLTNLDSGETLRGHVDAYYWINNPLGHAGEFLMKKTTAPADLLKRIQDKDPL